MDRVFSRSTLAISNRALNGDYFPRSPCVSFNLATIDRPFISSCLAASPSLLSLVFAASRVNAKTHRREEGEDDARPSSSSCPRDASGIALELLRVVVRGKYFSIRLLILSRRLRLLLLTLLLLRTLFPPLISSLTRLTLFTAATSPPPLLLRSPRDFSLPYTLFSSLLYSSLRFSSPRPPYRV